MVARFENWPILLSEYLQERQNMPVQWGFHDCLMFCAYGVERLTGEAFYGPYMNYETEEGAKLMMAQNGGPEGIMTACLGEPHTQILKARRGDLVLFKMPDLTAGMVDDTGQRIACISADRGMIKIPLNKAIKVWSY